MKKSLLILSFLVYTCFVCANILSIDNISNGVKVHDDNFFDSSLLRYENRLIVVGQFKTEEFLILPEGILERIASFDTKIQHKGYIDQDKFYSVSFKTNADITNITVYDLTKVPMKYIKNFDILEETIVTSLIFTDRHIMVSDPNKQRTVLICKQTYEPDGYINGFSPIAWAKSDSLIVTARSYIESDISGQIISFITIDDTKDYEINIISELKIPNFATFPLELEFQNGVLTGFANYDVVIVDIDDSLNPKILHQFSRYPYTLRYLLYSDDYLYFTELYRMVVIKLDENGVREEIYSDFGFLTAENNLHLDMPYLYANRGYGLLVYDVSDDFKIVYNHGNTLWFSTFIHNYDDVFLVELDCFQFFNYNEYLFDIYSILDEKFICSLKFENYPSREDLYIDDDILYFSYVLSGQHYLNIYQINGTTAELLKNIPVKSSICTNFYKQGNKIFFSYESLNQVDVYTIEGLNLNFESNFAGILYENGTNNSNRFIISINNNRLIFRDITDYNIILFDKQLPQAQRIIIDYLDENHFTFRNRDTGQFIIYEFNIEDNTMTMIRNFSVRNANSLNGIVTMNIDNEVYTYHSMIDKNLQQIGKKVDTTSMSSTFFYPNKKKMVEITGAGIWVYDFEYTTVSEKDIVAEIRSTGLIGNYPNPFNPNTTIKFRIENLELGIDSPHSYGLPRSARNDGGRLSYGEGRGEGLHVHIDIYNIKGQKVRSLVNAPYPAGEHSVVWNGQDNHGVGVSSGIYLYRMVAGDIVQTKKMVLLK